MQSNYQAVKQFTEESKNIKCPDVPSPMSKEEVTFLLKMVLSEMTELAQTVTESHEEAVELIQSCVGVDPSSHPDNSDETHVIANQGDAMVDSWYYMLNAAAKKGIDLSKIFDAVHQANMNKKDLESNKFILRDDGKVLKPEGWKPADILEVVKSMGK